MQNLLSIICMFLIFFILKSCLLHQTICQALLRYDCFTYSYDHSYLILIQYFIFECIIFFYFVILHTFISPHLRHYKLLFFPFFVFYCFFFQPLLFPICLTESQEWEKELEAELQDYEMVGDKSIGNADLIDSDIEDLK